MGATCVLASHSPIAPRRRVVILKRALSREELLLAYRHLLVTRGIEERGHILYKQGKIPGSFYTGRGNEAAAVAIGMAMEPGDVSTPLARDMGVHVVRGTEPWRIFAQYMGRTDGPMGGRDGSMHMGIFAIGTIPHVSHLPAMLPVAVGCALAFRLREEPRVAVAFFGDGSSSRSDTHEAMNLAGVRGLPVVFVCNNNGWAYSTPNYLEFACERIADRAAAYGFEGVTVDGTDLLAVHRAARDALERARSGGGPTLLESVTLRMEGHGAHDDSFYIPRPVLDAWAERDPIERFRAFLREHAGLAEEEDDALRSEVKRLLNEELRRAEESPLPEAATLLDGVYAE